MAKKKFYAVRKGLKTGVFESWEECQEVISGYSNAEYKSFSTKAEAEQYVWGTDVSHGDGGRDGSGNGNGSSEDGSGSSGGNSGNGSGRSDGGDRIPVEEGMIPEPGKIIAYVDGSYEDKLKKYSFGCILLTPTGEIIKKSGNGDNPASLAIRNVAGEMLGAMFAVKWSMVNGYREIELRYDYAGIEKWVQGEWKAKNELAQKYAAAMNDWKKYIGICFQKVTAHSNNKYNDMADELAKEALVKGEGVPKIRKEE